MYNKMLGIYTYKWARNRACITCQENKRLDGFDMREMILYAPQLVWLKEYLSNRKQNGQYILDAAIDDAEGDDMIEQLRYHVKRTSDILEGISETGVSFHDEDQLLYLRHVLYIHYGVPREKEEDYGRFRKKQIGWRNKDLPIIRDILNAIHQHFIASRQDECRDCTNASRKPSAL
jgi:uncharacterized protein (DUF2225 family)